MTNMKNILITDLVRTNDTNREYRISFDWQDADGNNWNDVDYIKADNSKQALAKFKLTYGTSKWLDY